MRRLSKGGPTRDEGSIVVCVFAEYNHTMIEINEFRRNQSRYPLTELEKFNGQYVAWSHDGTQILAAHPDALKLHATIQEAGYDPAEILVSFVAVPEEISWGGLSIPEAASPP